MNIINAMNAVPEMTEEEKEFVASIQPVKPAIETSKSEQFSFLNMFDNLIPIQYKKSDAAKPKLSEERPKIIVVEAKPQKNKRNSVEGQLTFGAF